VSAGGDSFAASAASAASIAAAVSSGLMSAEEAVGAALAAIGRANGMLNCFREVHAEEALDAARALDARRDRGERLGPLAGVPVAIKDNIACRLGTTACGSRMLEGYASPFDATVVEGLARAGAIVIGRTNCDEFAMGSSTEHCAYGAVRNPWDPRRVPGGSSGGSAAAVAAGLCPIALGSDTGGSVRQPAALCGVVGVKPSYGRVSRWGLVAYGSSLDQIGPLARSVEDAARVLQAIAGRDRRDSTSADRAVPDYLAQLDRPLDRLRIGVAREHRDGAHHPGVARVLAEAIESFRAIGAEIVDIELPLTEYGIATYYVIAPAEASSNLARYDGIRYGRRAAIAPGEDLLDLYARSRAEGFGAEVQRRIMLGTYVLSAGYSDAYYKRALQVRRLIKQELDRAFARCDAIVGPTSPIPAFEIGAKEDPLAMYLCDVFTTIANIAGICAMSVPGGFAVEDGTRLPVGIQVQCPAFDEATMLRVARAFERVTDHHRQRPPAAAAAPAS
jgi:aspartyl-tRNA(Asn)/glutamyl-tRNA(Gln) amidotransferase subunit A